MPITVVTQVEVRCFKQAGFRVRTREWHGQIMVDGKEVWRCEHSHVGSWRNHWSETAQECSEREWKRRKKVLDGVQDVL